MKQRRITQHAIYFEMQIESYTLDSALAFCIHTLTLERLPQFAHWTFERLDAKMHHGFMIVARVIIFEQLGTHPTL